VPAQALEQPTLRVLGAHENSAFKTIVSTPLAGPVGQIDDDARAALERDVTTAWRPFQVGDALRLDIDAVLTTARK